MEVENHPSRFHWVHAVVIVVCLIGLLTLLWPAIQASRSSRKPNCENNLKNIALGLQNYHDVFRMLPAGVMHAGSVENPRIGPSWWYALRPFLDTGDRHYKFAATQDAQFEPPGVAFTYADMPAEPYQQQLREDAPRYMRCHSTPLPLFERQDGFILMPSYVGIAGGCDIDPDSTDFDGCPVKPTSGKRYRNEYKGTGPNNSIVTSSGLLPPNQQITIAMCTDGISNTMVVGEQSGFLHCIERYRSDSFHGDPGWNPPSDKNPAGWLSGTDMVGSVGKANGFPNASRPGDWHADVLLNVTTVRYPPDLNQVLGSDPYPGCAEVMGHNNPLQSPHPGGLLVGLLDGSVQFISSTTDLTVLLRLAIRDDGQDVDLD